MDTTTLTSLGWNLDIIVSLVSLIAGGIITTIAALFFRFFEDGFSIFGLIIGIFGTMFGAIFFLVCAIPFNGVYWNLYEVQGTVASVSNQFVDGSGDITDGFVMTLEGNGTPIKISDPRITKLIGQDVTFVCSPSWVYQGADQWSCSIRSAGYTK